MNEIKRYKTKSGNSVSKMTLGTVQLGLEYGIANKEGRTRKPVIIATNKPAKIFQ